MLHRNNIRAAAKAFGRTDVLTRLQAADELNQRRNQEIVNDWLIRFHTARNSACNGHEMVSGINLVR